jgi:hypothetical protein
VPTPGRCAQASVAGTQTESVQETTMRNFLGIERRTKGDIFSPS